MMQLLELSGHLLRLIFTGWIAFGTLRGIFRTLRETFTHHGANERATREFYALKKKVFEFLDADPWFYLNTNLGVGAYLEMESELAGIPREILDFLGYLWANENQESSIPDFDKYPDAYPSLEEGRTWRDVMAMSRLQHWPDLNDVNEEYRPGNDPAIVAAWAVPEPILVRKPEEE